MGSEPDDGSAARSLKYISKPVSGVLALSRSGLDTLVSSEARCSSQRLLFFLVVVSFALLSCIILGPRVSRGLLFQRGRPSPAFLDTVPAFQRQSFFSPVVHPVDTSSLVRRRLCCHPACARKRSIGAPVAASLFWVDLSSAAAAATTKQPLQPKTTIPPPAPASPRTDLSCALLGRGTAAPAASLLETIERETREEKEREKTPLANRPSSSPAHPTIPQSNFPGSGSQPTRPTTRSIPLQPDLATARAPPAHRLTSYASVSVSIYTPTPTPTPTLAELSSWTFCTQPHPLQRGNLLAFGHFS